MPMILNPGSENKGGTLEQALINAKGWLKSIHSDGFHEVELSSVSSFDDGLWCYTFRHTVTGNTVELQTHGFTDEERDSFTFSPRVYWNGSSTAEPCIEDWLADGWKHRVTYYQEASDD